MAGSTKAGLTTRQAIPRGRNRPWPRNNAKALAQYDNFFRCFARFVLSIISADFPIKRPGGSFRESGLAGKTAQSAPRRPLTQREVLDTWPAEPLAIELATQELENEEGPWREFRLRDPESPLLLGLCFRPTPRPVMSFTHSESVTSWVRLARSGDDEAARKLWERYFQRIVDLARGRLGASHAAFDEEDVALSSFDRVLRALRFKLVDAPADRYEFWGLLRLNLQRRMADRLKLEGAFKRGGGRGGIKPRVRRQHTQESLDRLPSRSEDPQIAAAMAETCRRMLDMLEDEELEKVAIRKLEGLTDVEIAAKLDYSQRTVQRMLRNIRTLWIRSSNLFSD